MRMAISVASSNGSASPRWVVAVSTTCWSTVLNVLGVFAGEQGLQPLGAEHDTRFVFSFHQAIGVEEEERPTSAAASSASCSAALSTALTDEV